MAQGHVPWTDIENFHNVRRSVSKYPHLLGPGAKVTYMAKVKLHGTNAGVHVSAEGNVTVFSRSNVITSTNDNAGFAAWVNARADKFSRMALGRALPCDFVIYGEWCGPGIQKGVAISQVEARTFAVFAIRFLRDDMDSMLVSPDNIEAFLGAELLADVKVLPWHGGSVLIDWAASTEDLQPVLDVINEEIAAIEACDPWVSKVFNVQGVGEGLVFYPQHPHGGYKLFSDLGFKAKGAKHAVVAKTKPVQADPTVAASASVFADLVVTEPRMMQGLSQGLTLDIRNIGPFLKWVGTDVAKETQAELEASGLDPKVASKAVNDRARMWFMEQLKKA